MRSYRTLALAAMLVACHVTLIKCQEEDKKKDAKYLIIGAGIAGLAAAKNLAEHNETDFLILEGYSKIGGRVRTEVVNGVTLEVGNQWINSYSSPIGQLASRVNLKVRSSDYYDYIFKDKNGEDVSDMAYGRYDTFTPAYQYMQDLANNLTYTDKKKPDIPVRAALALGGWRPRDYVDYAIEYYDLDFVYGHEPETTSTRHTLIPSFGNATTYDETVVIDQDGGLFKVVQQLYDDVMTANDPRLKLNHVVTDISYTDDGVTVTTSDNRTFTADYVIITVSLGVLQNDVIAFDPPLPGWKRYSIMAATFVTDYPIYVIFDKDEQPFSDRPEFIVHCHDRRGYYTMWQNYDKLINGSRILQVQLTGFEAKRVARLSDDEIKAELASVMSKMFGVSVSGAQLVVGRWDTDPLHYGSYTDWSAHFGESSSEGLRAAVGRLYFAGEAYHREFFGYMEGAYQSAIDQTDQLLRCVADSSQCEHFVPPYEAQGCTYKAATNYDGRAQMDDGSCQFERGSKPISGSSTAWPKAAVVLFTSLLVLVL